MSILGGGRILAGGLILGGDIPGGGPGGGTPPPEGEITVPLEGKHNTFIAVAVQYIDESGATVWGPTQIFTYDEDLIAQIASIEGRYLGTGEVIPSVVGDEDTRKIYLNVGVGSPPADPTAAVHDGVIVGDHGEPASTGRFARYGDFVFVAAAGENKAGAIGPVKLVGLQRGDASKHAPKAHVTATRVADNIAIAIDVDDATLSVSSIQYKARTGSDPLDAVWQSAFDIGSTGVIGTDTSLFRIRNITGPDGLDGEFSWRIQFTNENGSIEEIGDTIYFSTLRELTKVLHAPFTSFVGENVAWDVRGGASPAATGVTVSLQASVVLPPGVEMTEGRVRVHVWDSSTAEIWIYRNPDSMKFGTGFVLPSTLGHEPSFAGGLIGSGNVTKVFALAETVADLKYRIRVDLNAVTVPDDAILCWAEIDYHVPSYEFTI